MKSLQKISYRTKIIKKNYKNLYMKSCMEKNDVFRKKLY